MFLQRNVILRKFPDDQRLDIDRTMSLIVNMCSDKHDRQAVFLFRRRHVLLFVYRFFYFVSVISYVDY